jgi:SAM-dependent methyltransferase
MARSGWNRNVHYHHIVLRAVPPSCRRALDVGCGDGRLASELAEVCAEVVGIDNDAPTIARARSKYQRPNLEFVDGDAMTHPFATESFDFISTIATLHHLPLEPALRRMSQLLRPGGVLAVIGLHPLRTPADFAYGVVGKLYTIWMHVTHPIEPVLAPVQDPEESLEDVRAAVEKVLPGAYFRRELLFRYSLVWRKAPGIVASGHLVIDQTTR